MTWTPPSTVCVRQAWLTLGSLTMPLENQPGGWFCSSLDLGYPDVRDVVNVKPDQDGVDDRTQYFGARAVTANITAIRGAGARIDDVADNFAPFMAPNARPVLHWILDRPGAAERTLTVRASGYSMPIVGADQRDIQLAWVAADPIARDPNQQTATAWAGSATAPGRGYPLTFNRIYPAGGGSPTTAYITSPGDIPVRPLLRIYGPVQGAQITLPIYGPAAYLARVWLLSSYFVAAGHWVDVDCARKTALLDSLATNNVINQIDWANTVWPVIPPAPVGGSAQMWMAGSNTSGVTQVQAFWQDGYIS